MDRDREFGEFVDARALVMRRTAYLLCGDWHRAEDIVQTALIKMYVAWSRVRKDSVDAYARKVLVRTAIDETRRGFFQRERIVDAVPESAVTDAASDLDLRRALDALPPGQRAVVVLRYWEDLSITETARILGRTEGTVKSQAAKGLAALRDLLENEPVSRIYTSEVIRKGRTKLVRRRTAIAGAMAFVLLAGAGMTGYFAALPHKAAAPAFDSAGTAPDRDAELTGMLRRQYALPTGITAEDVPEIQAKAFVFFTRNTNTPDNLWRAVARLRDAQGVGGLTIAIGRTTEKEFPRCEESSCRLEEREGIKVRSVQIPVPDQPGAQVISVSVIRPDGTATTVTSDNLGRFSDNVWGQPALSGPPQRSAPLLDREELIKIATLPGLTF